MNNEAFHRLYDFSGQVVVVTGGAGVLCACMCRTLAASFVTGTVIPVDGGFSERRMTML